MLDYHPELEARMDASGRRVWIVDTAVHKVIAALDCGTNVVTGGQETVPDWADPQGGEVLWRVASP